MTGFEFSPRSRGFAEEYLYKVGRSLLALAAFPFILSGQRGDYTFENAQGFLKQYCQGCHQGNSPAGGFDTQKLSTAASIQSEAERWNKVALRVKNGEMPPKVAPAPPVDQREQ